MVQLTEGLQALSPDDVSLYYATDPQLSNLPILVFHGASTTTNSTQNSSRIQVHVFSAAGFQTYPRLTVSPNSPFYAAVEQLPRDSQGDEDCRGLAFGLMRYFKDLTEAVKTTLIVQSSKSRVKRPGPTPVLFGEQHAANLAYAMVRVENMSEVIQDIEAALQPQLINHVDIDLVLPPGSIAPFREEFEDALDDDESSDTSLLQYGSYAPLVKLFGVPAFLPTSKLRRAPSKPTSLNRSTSFLKEQKMALRREMGELVDTEERYVIKMHDLVNHMADDFRQRAKTKAFGSFSPSEQDLRKLFPSSLDKILSINSTFLKAIRKVMDETEEEAMQDLEKVEDCFRASRYGGTGRPRDPTGALAFAKTLLEWFPRFSECYQDYIRASQEFPQIITSFLKQQSSFSQRVQQTGEQRLRSAVIEPVQRLPRYSLFIDNIVNYLPMSHPALRSLLKARDIITAICSLDSPTTDKHQVVNRLRALVESWPSNLFPQGRLISTADFSELSAPFHIAGGGSPSNTGMLLLFADSLVILRRTRGCTLSARGLLAEVDKPSAAAMIASMAAAAAGDKPLFELSFAGCFVLSDIRFTESNEGRVAWMTYPHDSRGSLSLKGRASSATAMRAFVLQGAYDGKVSKWTEEVVKAKIEGRFSEEERETDKWCLRNVKLNGASLNVFAAVFEEGVDSLIKGRKEPAPIRIVVDHDKGTKGAPVGHYGVEIVSNIIGTENLASSTCRLEIDGLNDRVFIDAVDANTFMPVFAKRVGDLLRNQHVPGNPVLTTAFVSHYSDILRALHIKPEGERTKHFRPPSPVKMLSNFLNGGGSFSTTSTPTKQPRTPQLGNIPSMPPPSLPRSNSQKSLGAATELNDGNRAAIEENGPINPLFRLEETLTGYIASLQCRKGNVVGKSLRARAVADELNVNALYNAFIENPFDTRTSSEMSVDVLFASFEKFLRMAWKEQMGPVMTLQTLQALQEKSLKLFPGDFADFIKIVFGDMAPQNRRAFVAIVKLLADLLEGCGNDGDRGSLTGAFAELLVVDANPHDFINLLDRLVEDADRLFDDVGPAFSSGLATPLTGSVSSATRSNFSTNTGSLSSNTSSIRKRFGLDTLLRQNSKNESDSRPSMWRTLSKSSRNAATGEPTSSSLSKASLHRSRSIDTDTRLGSQNRRPSSRDRPTVLGAFDDRPSSSHMQSRLSTIGASPPPEEAVAAKPLKKKRRSSLSDLKSLLASATLDSPSSIPAMRRLPLPEDFHSSPRADGGDLHRARFPTPTKSSIARPLVNKGVSPRQKEQGSISSRNKGNLTERPHNVMSDDTVIIKDLWSAKAHIKTISQSNIPVPKGIPRDDTPTSTPTRPTSSPQKGSPQKLRLQSPQKLRERLQNEAKAINAVEASLQSELSKIGEEMARLNFGRATHDNSAEIKKLSDSVNALESRISVVIKDLTSRNQTVKEDLEVSLQASEYKVKGLDQLYKEASAENELLYEKFNGELGKIVKALKGKGKEDKEELVVKMKESTESTAKWKKENAKLRREILTLKTMLKGNE